MSKSKIIEQRIEYLDKLRWQTAVHRKKFEYTMYLLKQIDFSKVDLFAPNKFINVNSILDDFQALMMESLLNNWPVSTMQNNSNQMFERLLFLFESLKNIICDPKSDYKWIEINQDLWKEFNHLDLKAIAASFTQSK